MQSYDDMLEAADGEIERLWGLLDNARGRIEHLRDENEALKADLVEAKKDAEIF